MNSFADGLVRATNFTRTENGALAHQTSLNNLVDFFGRGAATHNTEAFNRLFVKAYAENPLYAVRILFYIRDIRGGQGRRDVFRNALLTLAQMNSEGLTKNIGLIPEYGRWDDLFILLDTPVRDSVLRLIRTTLDSDLSNLQENKPVTLLAKWLPSENASSKETKKLAVKIRTYLGLSSKDCRKTLSSLRKYIDVVERKMSSREFSTIDYQKVPSNAMKIYRTAFFKRDEARFQSYIDAVTKGEKKINSKTLYPYEIYDAVKSGKEIQLLNEMWKALPNYMETEENSIVVADVSGSMSGRPMSVSVSLALYFSERIKGAFKDYFITFSARPKMQKVVGKTLFERMNCIERAQWGMNTDFNAVFRMILYYAVQNNVPESEMIKKLYVISDMQFDSAGPETNFHAIKDMYAQANYEMPQLVFWNVDARNTQTPITVNDKGVFLVSGFSPSILKYAINQRVINPIDIIEEVVNSDRYSVINL